MERAPFARKALWVTPYHEEQFFAGGFYPNQSNGDDTLEKWANESDLNIKQTDIVIWYTFGLTHLPRIEDFLIMPFETCGFNMKPLNLFIANLAIDVPPTNKQDNKSVQVILEESSKKKKCCLNKL